ncbi:MAG: hypothetical protein P8P74_04765 [Crocinitomicaceae bacterium]|nr:hypothetical protein [Crocinitomicaceae bacterium]
MIKLVLFTLAFCSFSVSAQTYFEEDFNNQFLFTNWQNIDNDSDPSGNYDDWSNIQFTADFPEFEEG